MLKVKAPKMLNSMVELAETYVSGLDKNKHKNKIKFGRGGHNKTAVFAILEKQGNVWTTMVKEPSATTLKPLIKKHIDKSNVIVTDGFKGYVGLHKQYKDHVVVNHQKNEWTKGEYHTNTIKGYFGQLKRGIVGIYHHVDPKHSQRYCDEFSFKYNSRKSNEVERFNYALTVCDKRLKYKDLIKTERKRSSVYGN